MMMAPPKVVFLLELLLLSAAAFYLTARASSCSYSALFSFGDSLADTGNRAIAPDHTPSFCIKPPYGMTYFNRPTGRCSDGRLIIDFIAEATGLPLVPPYLGGWKDGVDFRKGVNFAVAGATAIENSFFTEKGLTTWTNNSLGVQVQWFKSLLPSLCPQGRECDLLSNSLFMVGEIGGNDLNYPFFARRTLQEIKGIIPRVISTISSSVQELIDLGARTLLVPGNFPIGCSAAYLRQFSRSAKKEDFDPSTGCLKWLNQIASTYNQQLRDELALLRQRNPGVNVVYVDYYNAAMQLFRAPSRFGLNDTLDACCHQDSSSNSPRCGDPGSSTCEDPSTFLNWDGVHLTEAAYNAISAGIVKGGFTSPAFPNLCPKSVLGKDGNHFVAMQ